MVVDDSAVIRGLIARILEADASVEVLATASNGEQAIKLLSQNDIEVIVLDIEMPVMDGLTALPKLLAISPRVKIIMASTLTQRNAQISFKALSAGATDYIPKPTASREITQGEAFHRELREKVKALGQAYRGSTAPVTPSRADTKPRQPASTAIIRTVTPTHSHVSLSLRKAVTKPASVLAIGSSTGGPQALLALLRNLDRSIQVPVLITQHMPPTFTTILAEHVARASGRACAEAQDGEPIKSGCIYIAPGDWHMVVEQGVDGVVIRLNQQPAVNFCRPAVDPMFSSVARVYDGRVLAVVLTGMGQDGLNGGKAIIEAGGTVIAQDEATSVVWGMPGAVATAGVCSAVLPLDQMSGFIRDFPKRAAP